MEEVDRTVFPVDGTLSGLLLTLAGGWEVSYRCKFFLFGDRKSAKNVSPEAEGEHAALWL